MASLSKISVVLQTPAASSATHAGHINNLLGSKDLVKFRVISAFARWEGIGLIASALESFLDRGGEFQSIYGVANGVTTPDSLLYSLYLQKLGLNHTYAGVIESKFENSIFHPKLFDFIFENKRAVIIGSANLTGAGLTRNFELSVNMEFGPDLALNAQFDNVWDSYLTESQMVNLKLIKGLLDSSLLSTEKKAVEDSASIINKPFFTSSEKTKKKPLFKKVLGVSEKKKKTALLSEMSSLSEKPQRLYLQILKKETGAAKGGTEAGYQIQLPVATLSLYFGVGANETKDVEFHFPGETLHEKLTHFSNHTHRVRLKPLVGVKRPAILVFDRLDEHKYSCSLVNPSKYEKTLVKRCVEQTRKGARRWGVK